MSDLLRTPGRTGAAHQNAPALDAPRTPLDESYQGENLVFLVGCPRSGTTWLQRLLSSHPDVRTGQESHLFSFYVGPQLRTWRRVLNPAATGRGGIGIGCYLTEEEFLAVVRRYMLSLLTPILAPVGPGELFLEKTPGHALYVPEIRELLPKARFIHMVRDPRDVVASLLAASRSWGAGWAPRGAWDAARTWNSHVRSVRGSAAALDSSPFFEVRYEALHERPAEILGGVADFLGLQWSEAERDRAVESNRADAVRRGGGTAIPLGGAFANPTGIVSEPDGFVRRARPGSWRQDLSWWERTVTSAIAGPLMERLGYGGRPRLPSRVLAALLDPETLRSLRRRGRAAPR